MNLTQRLKHIHTWRIGGLLLADIIVFGSTNPRDVPSSVLIIGFLLVCVTAYHLINAMLMLAKLYGLPIRHRKRALKSLTLMMSGLIALQSLGQLGFHDVLVLLPLSMLAYFYIAYSRSARSQPAFERSLEA